MRIEWNTLSPAAWYDIYLKIPKTNLLQSYAYAKAMREVHFQNTRFGHILDDKGRTLGLVNMQYISLFGVVERVFIDRGPLWLSDTEGVSKHQKFWTLINDLYPKRPGRKRRFIPEIDNNSDILKQVDLVHTAEGYETIWLDLSPSLEILRAGLKSKWRNMLKRAEEEDLTIECDDVGLYLDYLLAEYMKDRFQKGYSGASPKFIRALHKNKSPYEHGRIYLAKSKGQHNPIAMIYIFIHGTSATYQIGWSNPKGRDTRAHYRLIWDALKDLKALGIKYLDLGGINEKTAKGVTRFKKGLGGIPLKTLGIYK